MIDIEVSQETTNRLHAILSGLGKADEKVLKPAMQRGLIAGRTAFNKQIKSVYYVSPAVISRYSHIGKYAKSEQNSHKGRRKRTGGKFYGGNRKTAGNGKYERHRGKIYLYRTDNKHRVGRKYDFYRKQGNS